MRLSRIVAPLALAGAVWVQAAVADAHGAHACRADVERLCGEARYSRAGIAACLDQHSADLSPDCRQRFEKMKAWIDQFHQACDTDVQKLCATADRGPMTFRCLRDHRTDLSEACKTGLAEARAHRRHWKHAGEAPPPAAPPSDS